MRSALTSVGGHGLRAPPFVPAAADGCSRPGRDSRRGAPPFRVRAGTDDGTVEEFESALVRYCATTTGDVVVDGSDLEFIDGSGLRTLLGIEQQLRPLGRRLVLRGFPASCRPAIERAALVAGTTVLQPFDRWVSRTLEDGSDLVAACEEAAAAPYPDTAK